jgi:sugar/nucleoside kinase (ribokinase family)
VDTNGAGDVHVGAFVAALARGLDPVEAVAAANTAAAAWVSLPGTAR